MNVDDYFEVYTGGNDYIKTWTPKALKEFAEDYHKQKLREGENGVLPLVSNSAFVKMLQKQQNKICSCCGNIEKAGWKECGCDQEGFNKGVEKAIEMFIKHYC